jgi:hypothetical protein
MVGGFETVSVKSTVPAPRLAALALLMSVGAGPQVLSATPTSAVWVPVTLGFPHQSSVAVGVRAGECGGQRRERRFPDEDPVAGIACHVREHAVVDAGRHHAVVYLGVVVERLHAEEVLASGQAAGVPARVPRIERAALEAGSGGKGPGVAVVGQAVAVRVVVVPEAHCLDRRHHDAVDHGEGVLHGGAQRVGAGAAAGRRRGHAGDDRLPVGLRLVEGDVVPEGGRGPTLPIHALLIAQSFWKGLFRLLAVQKIIERGEVRVILGPPRSEASRN